MFEPHERSSHRFIWTLGLSSRSSDRAVWYCYQSTPYPGSTSTTTTTISLITRNYHGDWQQQTRTLNSRCEEWMGLLCRFSDTDRDVCYVVYCLYPGCKQMYFTTSVLSASLNDGHLQRAHLIDANSDVNLPDSQSISLDP